MAQVGTAAASQGLELCLGLGKVSASLRAGFLGFFFFLQGSQGLWVGVQVSAGSIFQVVQID